MVAISYQPSMAATAILTARPNSHPFIGRRLILDAKNLNSAVKIGRAVARAKASPSNGIFDCKVLSRNHALLWYADGKFFLKDTKSSNGTYVNNHRLSKSNEESSDHEIYSGDVIQFGVDVVETSHIVVTHGCIVANVKLLLPDGKEAKASQSASLISSLPLDELYQLNLCIQEALQRENILYTKLAKLTQLVVDLKKATDLSWKALIQEDRLLSKVELLESQLATYSKTFSDDKLQEEIKLLHKDKSTYETQLKEIIKIMLQEKVEALQKCQDTERKLVNVENECLNLQELLDKSQIDLEEFIDKYENQVALNKDIEATVDQLVESNKEKSNTLTQLQAELSQAQKKLDAFSFKDNILSDKLQNYYLNFHVIKNKILEIKQELNQEETTDYTVLVKQFDDVYQVMTKFNDYFLQSDKLGLVEDNINSFDDVPEELMDKLYNAKEEHCSLKEMIRCNEEKIAFLEESKYLHLDKIRSLELKLERLKQSFNIKNISTLTENNKLNEFDCDDKLLIEDEKTINNQKEILSTMNDINNESSEKDFISITEEIKETSNNLEEINKDINKCTEDLSQMKTLQIKNEVIALHLQVRLTNLDKAKKNIINSQVENNDSLQTQLNEAIDKINLYKVEHSNLTSEIEVLKNKLETTENKESELLKTKEECEKLRNTIKNYQNIVTPNAEAPLSILNLLKTEPNDDYPVFEENVTKSISSLTETINDQQNTDSNIKLENSTNEQSNTTNVSSQESNVHMSTLVIDVNKTQDPEQDSFDIMSQSSHSDVSNSDTDTDTVCADDTTRPTPVDIERKIMEDIRMLQLQSSTVAIAGTSQDITDDGYDQGADDDTDDSSSELDSSTLIRPKKIKNVEIQISTQSIHVQTDDDTSFSLYNLSNLEIPSTEEEPHDLLYRLEVFLNSYDLNNMSPFTLLGIITMFLLGITSIFYSFGNIISQITATYDREL